MTRDPRDSPPRGSLEVREGSLTAALLDRLREDLPGRRERFERAFAGDPPDTDAIATEAHRLAGAAAYCGQGELQAVAAKLEDAARAGDAERARNAWHRLGLVLDRLRGGDRGTGNDGTSVPSRE